MRAKRKEIAGQLAGTKTPAVLLGYQQRWAGDTSEVKVCEKSRRVGMTWAEASDDVLLAATRGRAGMDVLYISYSQAMTREYVDACADWARKLNKACQVSDEYLFADDDPDKQINAYRIDFASGHKILALSGRPTNLRGKQGRVVIDEAAFVDDLAELLKAALALLMWGGQIVILSTHNGQDNPFAELVEDIRAGRKPYSLHRVTLDDALADGLYRRICLVRGLEWSAEGEAAWRDKLVRQYGDGADEELFCIPSKGGDAYLPLSIIEGCMQDIPVLSWTPPAADYVDWPDDRRYRDMASWCRELLDPLLERLPLDRPHVFGQDFGRNVDLSYLWPLTELPGLTSHTPFTVEIRDCPFSQQEQLLTHIADRLPRLRGGALDATGNGAFLAERARQHYGPERIHEIKLSQAWYLAHMPRLKASLEDRTTSVPRDAGVRDDLRAVKRVRGVPMVPSRERTGEDKRRRHGDSAVACALAHYALAVIDGGEEFGVLSSAPLASVAMTRGYAL